MTDSAHPFAMRAPRFWSLERGQLFHLRANHGDNVSNVWLQFTRPKSQHSPARVAQLSIVCLVPSRVPVDPPLPKVGVRSRQLPVTRATVAH